MDIELNVEKFHRIIIRAEYVRRLKPSEQTIRNLLCYYLALACQDYPTEDEFNVFQGSAYDLQYKVVNHSVANTSVMSFILDAVDPKYIEDDNYTYKTLEDAFETCFKPVTNGNNFDLKLFRKAKEMYYSNLLYQEENESKIAYNHTISAHFKGTNRDFLRDGDIKSLEGITCKKLYNYYIKMLNDPHAYYRIGNVKDKFSINHENTLEPMSDLMFKKRIKHESVIYEAANTKQCYLNIIYDLKIFTGSKDFLAASFFNYAFGGSSNSELFKLVREKYGICYSISSGYLGASGIIMVSCILSKENVDKALLAIDEALSKTIKAMNLENIRQTFIDDTLAKNDYIGSYQSDDFLDRFYLDYQKSKYELDNLKAITMDDIKRVKRKVKKSLVYVYGGGLNE